MHGLQLVAAHGLSSCGARAYLLRGMWDPPGSGLEPASPALAGGFPTTEPPGKSALILYLPHHGDFRGESRAADGGSWGLGTVIIC